MLSVKDIRNIECKKKQIRKDLYKSILLNFTKKIKASVESGRNQTFLQIPMVVPGFPLFDRFTAAEYLSRQLKNLGYDVNHYAETEIYVTWMKGSKEQQEIDVIPSFINIHKLADNIRRKKPSK